MCALVNESTTHEHHHHTDHHRGRQGSRQIAQSSGKRRMAREPGNSDHGRNYCIRQPAGWLPHTTRAALTGLKKKGHTVTSTKADGVRTYRRVPAGTGEGGFTS
jgi:hypothetical protein